MLGEGENIWGSVYTRFRDVDGNSFLLVSFDEISQALDAAETRGGREIGEEKRVARELGDCEGSAGAAVSAKAASR